jgi:hypothetical protein
MQHSLESLLANHSYPTTDIGKYFSALANEANLKQAEKAWITYIRVLKIISTTKN